MTSRAVRLYIHINMNKEDQARRLELQAAYYSAFFTASFTSLRSADSAELDKDLENLDIARCAYHSFLEKVDTVDTVNGSGRVPSERT